MTEVSTVEHDVRFRLLKAEGTGEKYGSIDWQW